MTVSKILFADDDLEDQLIVRDAFSELDIADAISFVENGEEVIEYLNASGGQPLPQLIVLDLNMPKMNGTETLRALKADKRYKHINVIIFSTSVNEKEKKQCMELGAISYITKPVKYDEALTTARQFYGYVK